MGLRKELIGALKKIAELEIENRKLRKRNEELEKKMRLYESPHLSSSKRIIKEKVIDIEPERPKRKRGAPKGHKGVRRETPEPDEIVWVDEPDHCPNCSGADLINKKWHRRTVEDVEIRKVVKEFHWCEAECERCGSRFVASSGDLPKHGTFGPNLCSLWTMLHYHGTIPFDRLAEFSKNCLGGNVSTSGLHNAIYRTAGIFEPRYNRIRTRVANAEYVGSDETSYPFNREKWWLWTFRTAKDTAVLMRPSRGSNVLKEFFGEYFDGVLGSDCFSAYAKFKAREYQKCWAHVLRDAKDLAKHNDEGRELCQMLSRMHRYIKKAKKEGKENTLKVKLWVWRARRQIDSWVEKNYESKAVMNLALRMSKYRDQWFTCLKYSCVESTNNGTERDIRKNVVARKISGLHRSLLGVHSREIMMSVLLTARKRGQDPFGIVLGGIKKYNSSYKIR